ncbi:secA DEAD-like domain-containing protein [Ditylenchus destructor]|uniref:SecA DEAD-like domain-containing protein n=1 Tax=Ditylenchus destructor TaxID=166010 RepID=A0AAD4R3E6_9BILA|nr:secA DEAD-like domain-containing protein [Ditylenchus destructor]
MVLIARVSSEKRNICLSAMKEHLLALVLCFYFLIGYLVEGDKHYMNGSSPQCYVCPDSKCYFDVGHQANVFQVFNLNGKLTISKNGVELPGNLCKECAEHPHSKIDINKNPPASVAKPKTECKVKTADIAPDVQGEIPTVQDEELPTVVREFDPDASVIGIVATIKASRKAATIKATGRGTVRASVAGSKAKLAPIAEGEGSGDQGDDHIADSLATIQFGNKGHVAPPKRNDAHVPPPAPETDNQGTVKGPGTVKDTKGKAPAKPSDTQPAPAPAAETEDEEVPPDTVKHTAKAATVKASVKSVKASVKPVKQDEVAGSVRHSSRPGTVKGSVKPEAQPPAVEEDEDADIPDTFVARLIQDSVVTVHSAGGHHKSALEIIAEDEAVDESDNKELSFEELLSELVTSNKDNVNIIKKKSKLRERHKQISQAIEAGSKLFPSHSSKISQWTQTDIENWAKELKKERRNIQKDAVKSQDLIPEVIAVMMRAVEHVKGFRPRNAQILALLTMIYRAKVGEKGHEKEIGRLVQLGTGEGKSILAVLGAGFYGLMGNKVDVISTTLLAIRDAKFWEPYYKQLGLTVGNNAHRDDKHGPMPCYAKDVVYGSIGHFISHTLEDEFFASGTRMGRPYGVLIVDEVDDPAIDGRNSSTKLNSNVPGAEFLETAHTHIWLKLQELKANKDIRKPEDKKAISEGLKAYISNVVTTKQVHIPTHLYEYAKGQTNNWSESAIRALEMRDRYDYIISKEKNKIMIVDYRSSGLVHEDMHWGDALHELVIMKEKGAVRMTAEGLTSCFMSNTAYIRRYKENFFGMTGTLGSPEARKFLQKVYPVDVVEVPPYKKKRFKLYPSIIAKRKHNDDPNKDPWIDSILDVTDIFVNKKGRAVLIVFLTIGEVDHMEKVLRSKGYQHIRRYSRNDTNEGDAVNGDIKPGEVILATNIGARGTDFTITVELDKKGGLHVIGTFLAENLRIELQMFGRAARQGQRGSGNLVLSMDILANRYYYIHDLEDLDDVEEFKIIRDEEEKNQLNYYQEFDHESNVLMDELFQQFTEMLNKLRFGDKPRKENYNANKDPRWPMFSQMQEIWGLRYRYYSQKITDAKRKRHKDTLTKLYELIRNDNFPQLKEYLHSNFEKDPIKIFKNPSFLVEMGRKKMHDKKFEEAIAYFDRAAKIDPIFSFPALLIKGYTHVLMGEHEYKQAREDFALATANIEMHAKMYNEIRRTLQQQGNFLGYEKAGGHMRQIKNKIEILTYLHTMSDNARAIVDGCLLPYDTNHIAGCLITTLGASLVFVFETMAEPLKFFKFDDATIYKDAFSYSFYRVLDPPKSSADLQLHQLFHCAFRTEEHNCRSRIYVTGNWQMDKKGSKFMLGIVKNGDHTIGPEYRDTTPKFKFYKTGFESLHRNGFDYSLYRELDPPKQIADFQWHQTYRCAMTDQENCRARIYTTGQWEVNKRELEYQLGIFKNCIHSHESEQDANEENNENNIPAIASSSNHTKELDKKEQIRFYKFKEKTVQHDGFVYCYHTDVKIHLQWKCRMRCERKFNGKRTCTAYIWTTGKWDKDDRGREFQVGIVMSEHDHGPHQIAFQGKDNDDESPEAGLKFYKYIDNRVHRDGHVYCFIANLKSRPPWKQRMRCTRRQRGIDKKLQCNGYIWTTGEWETDSRGRLYQRGILRGGHAHDAYEQLFNEDDTAFVGIGGPTDDKVVFDKDSSV